jgi:hypothetical protein
MIEGGQIELTAIAEQTRLRRQSGLPPVARNQITIALEVVQHRHFRLSSCIRPRFRHAGTESWIYPSTP